MNPRTGAGTFSTRLLDGVRQYIPGVEFSVMTGEDYLKPHLFYIFKNWFRIRAEIKKAGMVHALDGYPYGVIACLAALGTGRPIIITAIGSGSVKQLRGWGLRSWLLRWAYARASRITAISHYVAEELKKELPNLFVEVINPGVDYDFWTKEEPTPLDQTLDKLRPYLLTQGELKRRKGYSVLLPIIKAAFIKRPEAHYVIVANTARNNEYLEELRMLIKELGLFKRVTFLSNLSREELRRVYQKARAYVLLPQNVNDDVEGFGLSILEAAAAGVPAVVGKGSGANDAVADSESGFLVESFNPDEVTERLTALFDDNTLRERLSIGARKWAMHMGWEKQIKKYVAIYQKFQG